MATLKTKYGTSTAITIGMASLATGTARESAAVDNGTNLYLDALVSVTVKTAAGTPGSDGLVYVYAYGSEDGTNFGDNATGSDAGLTMRTTTNLALIGVIACPTASTTYVGQPMSVAAAFGGRLPRKWGVVVENKTNLSLDSTGNAAAYTGVQMESV